MIVDERLNALIEKYPEVDWIEMLIQAELIGYCEVYVGASRDRWLHEGGADDN